MTDTNHDIKTPAAGISESETKSPANESKGDSPSSDFYQVWVQSEEGFFRPLKQFEQLELAQLYYLYASKFFETYPAFEIEELFVKKNGDPIYLLYYQAAGETQPTPDGAIFLDEAQAKREIQGYQQSEKEGVYTYQPIYFKENQPLAEYDGL